MSRLAVRIVLGCGAAVLVALATPAWGHPIPMTASFVSVPEAQQGAAPPLVGDQGGRQGGPARCAVAHRPAANERQDAAGQGEASPLASLGGLDSSCSTFDVPRLFTALLPLKALLMSLVAAAAFLWRGRGRSPVSRSR